MENVEAPHKDGSHALLAVRLQGENLRHHAPFLQNNLLHKQFDPS